jgi:hypothetical protein
VPVLLLASCFCRVSLRRFPSGGLQAGSVLYSAQFRCCAEVHARDKGHMEGLLVMCGYFWSGGEMEERLVTRGRRAFV